MDAGLFIIQDFLFIFVPTRVEKNYIREKASYSNSSEAEPNVYPPFPSFRVLNLPMPCYWKLEASEI